MLPFFVQVSLNSARNRIKTRRNLKFRQINIKADLLFLLKNFDFGSARADFPFFFKANVSIKISRIFFPRKRRGSSRSRRMSHDFYRITNGLFTSRLHTF